MAGHRRRGTLPRCRGWRASSVASARPHRPVSERRSRPVVTRATWAPAPPASACSWRGGEGSWRMRTLQRRPPARGGRAHDDRTLARRARRGGGLAQAAHGVVGIRVRHAVAVVRIAQRIACAVDQRERSEPSRVETAVRQDAAAAVASTNRGAFATKSGKHHWRRPERWLSQRTRAAIVPTACVRWSCCRSVRDRGSGCRPGRRGRRRFRIQIGEHQR